MARSIVVNFLGNVSHLKKSTDEAASGLDKFGQKVGNAGKKMTTFATVPIVGFLTAATKAGLDERKEMSGLELAIKSATGARHLSTKATEAWITKMQDATGFVDGTVRASFGKLIAITHDYRKAQALTAFAADLARAKNITLEEATDALTSAETGRVKGLQKMGLSVKDAAGKALTLTEIMKRNSGAVKGSASAFAEGAGKGDVMQHKLQDVSEAIGGILIPFMDRLTGVLTKVTGWFQNLSEGQKKMIVTVALVIAAIGPLLVLGSKLVQMFKAIKIASAFLGKNPWVIALIAVVAVILLVIKHFDKIKSAAKKTWDVLQDVFKTGINFIIGLIEKWLNIMTLPFRKFSGLLGHIPGLGSLKKLSEEISIPRLHQGGVVPGGRGDEMLAILRGGERVSPDGGGGGVTVIVQGSVVTERQLVQVIRSAMLKGGRSNLGVGLV